MKSVPPIHQVQSEQTNSFARNELWCKCQHTLTPLLYFSHVFVAHFCDSVWSFWEEENLCRFYLLFISALILKIKLSRGGVGIPLTCHIFVPISSQDLIFHQHMSWSLLFQYHFVDISGIVDITIQTFNNLVVWFPWLMVPKNHLLQYYSDYYTRLLLNKQRGS